MHLHEVKSWPWFFQAMIDGQKKHDFRDGSERDYKIGDHLLLQEFDPRDGKYTGREAQFKITYITSNMTPCALSSTVLANGFVVLSVEKV